MKKLIQACVLVACCLAPLSAVWAQQVPSLKKGNYNGTWHGDKVKFDIEKVSKNGTFSGVIHFDPKGPWANVTSAFTGQIDPKGSIVIQRPDSQQQSRAGAPKHSAKFWHWTGETTGKNLDKGYPFELKIPQ